MLFRVAFFVHFLGKLPWREPGADAVERLNSAVKEIDGAKSFDSKHIIG